MLIKRLVYRGGSKPLTCLSATFHRLTSQLLRSVHDETWGYPLQLECGPQPPLYSRCSSPKRMGSDESTEGCLRHGLLRRWAAARVRDEPRLCAHVAPSLKPLRCSALWRPQLLLSLSTSAPSEPLPPPLPSPPPPRVFASLLNGAGTEGEEAIQRASCFACKGVRRQRCARMLRSRGEEGGGVESARIK